MPAKKNAVPPSRFVVVVSVTDPGTGEPITIKKHECRDILHARTLLTEVRELAEDIQEFLPGLSAEGYEIGESFSLTAQGQTALEAAA